MSEGPMDPARLPPEALARVLQVAGSRLVSPELISQDLAAGAPRNADGKLHLVHIAAWLIRERARGQ